MCCTWLLPTHPGIPWWQKKKDKKGTYNHEVEVFWQQIPHEEEQVSDMRSLTTCLSLLDLLCALPACCLRLATLLLLSPREGVCHQIPHYRMPACWRTLQGLLPETCCFLPDFFLDLPSTCTFLLPKTGHAAAALPLHFCLRPSEQCATGPLLDPGGDYPCFMQFLLLSYLFYCPPSLPYHPNL